ncbi:MAG: hypothetical protein A4E62_01065 [Syntrophorhabdus sp. PtaU1.Bin002]|nr:MAG: hypothetical protein A4E62_01065 [Syntrophorhabdus sp. PtaU1.Bin002]
MRIGVIHTAGSPCGCAEAVSVGLKARGHEMEVVDSEEIELHAEGLFDYLCALRSAGRSDFKDIGSRWCIFRNLFICASGPRTL